MAIFKQDSRYRGSVVTQLEFQGELRNYVVLKKLLDIPLNEEDSYVTLDQELEFRPDLISYAVYGTPDYGWAIMEVNGIQEFFQLKLGLRLRIPPLDKIREAIPKSQEV